jgi:uncharacterized protein YjbJ (UPF0337 family)
MSGTMDKIKGTAKEGAGSLTGDEKLKSEGTADKVKGDLKDAAGNAKDAAKGVADSVKRG